MNKLKFTEKNYNQYDQIAKSKAIEFLQSKGFTHVPVVTEMYCDGDLVIYNQITDKNYMIEVEVKNIWKGEKFPYKTIHVPKRKEKSRADLFIMFNSDLSFLFITKMKSILNSKVVHKATLNKLTGIRTFNEPFFEFSMSNGKFYKL